MNYGIKNQTKQIKIFQSKDAVDIYVKHKHAKPCESAFFPELSFPEPSVGKSPEVRENPSFLGGVTPCSIRR